MQPDHFPGFIREILSVHLLQIQCVPVIQGTREFPKVQHLLRCEVFLRPQSLPFLCTVIPWQLYSACL